MLMWVGVDMGEQHLNTCHLWWDNIMVPRGLVMGCHVAPLHWLVVEKVLDSTGVKLATSRHGGMIFQG
jgi:hypothetical protein